MFKRLFEKFFDYHIVGEYLDTDSKSGKSRVKYIKKYYLKNRKKRGVHK